MVIVSYFAPCVCCFLVWCLFYVFYFLIFILSEWWNSKRVCFYMFCLSILLLLDRSVIGNVLKSLFGYAFMLVHGSGLAFFFLACFVTCVLAINELLKGFNPLGDSVLVHKCLDHPAFHTPVSCFKWYCWLFLVQVNGNICFIFSNFLVLWSFMKVFWLRLFVTGLWLLNLLCRGFEELCLFILILFNEDARHTISGSWNHVSFHWLELLSLHVLVIFLNGVNNCKNHRQPQPKRSL